MKAAVVKGPAKVVVEDVQQPQLGSGDILVKMQACGICGSDLEKVFGKYSQPSMRLGHEPSGIITRVGEKVNTFKQGDRVFVHHHVPCYSCHFCLHGAETMCPNYYETNLDPCGLADQFLVPEWNVVHGGVIPLPSTMSFEEGALIEPLACCVRAWSKISYQKDDSTAIFGVGSTGIMHVMLAKDKGIEQIFCVDVNDFRLKFTKQFEIADTINPTKPNYKEKIISQTNNRGADLVIVATGSLQAIADAIDVVRKGGTIVLFGVPSKNAILNLDISKVYSKEIMLVPTYAASDNDTKQAFELIHAGKVNVKKLITHKYPLSESTKAFEHAHNSSDSMKIIITS